VILNISFVFLGSLLFLFLFWRRLKEDYVDEIIFTTAFSILLGSAVGLVFSINYYHDWWFWFGFLGSLLGLCWGIYRFKLKVFEAIEAFVAGCLPLYGLVMLVDWVRRANAYSGIGFFIVLALFALFLFLGRHYKNFHWYRSGKIGFSGLTTLGLFFLTRTAIATFSFDVLSFVGQSDAILSGILAFGCFLAIFNLARREI
jgi:hypothetical protein